MLRQVQTFDAPQPMQKNSCFSGSNATGSPQPHAWGVGAREAWTRRGWNPGVPVLGTRSDVFVSSVMDTADPGCYVTSVRNQ